MKVAEMSGVLFASCSNAPKRGKKCDEFKSLYQNILKLLFCGHISLLQRKTTPLEISPHMDKRYAIWWRSSVGSALVRVRQSIWSECSATATDLFHRSGLKHYSTICLLTLRVKFDGISRRTPELEHLPWRHFSRFLGFFLLATWRQRKGILSPAYPKTEHFLSLFCKSERFILFVTWGTAPLQRLYQNMVRTW